MSYNYIDRYANNRQRTYTKEIEQGIKTIGDQLVLNEPKSLGNKEISLELLIKLSVYLNTEVGLFMKDDKLYVGKGRETGISVPEGFRIIAHTHPTNTTDKSQITRDMQVCDEQVELAVTINGLIIYYNNGHCYNKKNGNDLEQKLEAYNGFIPGTIGLTKVLDIGVLEQLGRPE
jgi:hypothetical protein